MHQLFIANMLSSFFLLHLNFLWQIFYVSQRLTTKTIPLKSTNIDDNTTKKVLNTKELLMLWIRDVQQKNHKPKQLSPTAATFTQVLFIRPFMKKCLTNYCKISAVGSTMQSSKENPLKGYVPIHWQRVFVKSQEGAAKPQLRD